MITDVNSRKAILKTKGKCFVCLRSGHKASECKSINNCYKCGSQHHLSICDFHFIREKKTDEDEKDLNNAYFEWGRRSSLTVVFNKENSNKKKNVRILFDKGSQKSFINQSLRDEFNL